MRETRADTTLAITAALLLHALIFAALFFGLRLTPPSPAGAGEPVTADLVDPNALGAAALRALAEPTKTPPPPQPKPPEQQAAPPPQPMPSPVPEDAQTPRQAKPQEQLPQPDVREQERVDRNAVSPETAPKEQQEQHRQAQVDLTDLDKQQKEAEQKRLLAEQTTERANQIKLDQIKKARAAEQRRIALLEQQQQQLKDAQARNAAEAAAQADSTASAPRGQPGSDTGLRNAYIQALSSAIRSNWKRPGPDLVPGSCRLKISQIPGGDVLRVEAVEPCDYDEAEKRSIEAAVYMARPLPYAGFEKVFDRNLTITFKDQD